MAEEAPSKSSVEGDQTSYGATEGTSKATGGWKWVMPWTWQWKLPSNPSSPTSSAEGSGTFCSVSVVGCAVTGPAPAPWAPTAIAALLMVMVYATGPISGGNSNPAVSLGLAISGKMPWLQMLKYWAAQLIGAFSAALAYRCICAPNYVMVAPILPFGAGSCFVAEFFYTFVLVFVVLNCAALKRTNPGSDPNQFYGSAIGFVIVAGGHAVGAVSGAASNPASALSSGNTSGKEIHWCWLWCVAELSGGASAAGVFRSSRREEFAEDATDETLQAHEPGLLVSSAAEFLGTFVSAFTVGMNLVSKSPSTAFSAAAASMCMVYSLGNISGAHSNPAVTSAVSSRGKCGRSKAACYVAAQLLGGSLAGLSVAAFQGVSANRRKSIQLTMGKHYGLWQASFAELFFTMISAYVVSMVATKEVPAEWKTKQNAYFGSAIGSCVTAGGFAAGSISGGELNPAVSLSIYMANVVNPGHSGIGPFVNLASFVFFELLGGALAAGLFRSTETGAGPSAAKDDKVPVEEPKEVSDA